MKGTFSYHDYVRLCSHSDNDYVYLLDVQTSGSVVRGNYESVQNMVPNDKYETDEGHMYFSLTYDHTWDPSNFPDSSGLNQSYVIGLLAHTLPENSQVTIEWYANGGASPVRSRTVNIPYDHYLSKHFQKNDVFVFEEDDISIAGYDWISRVTVTISNEQDQQAALGRLWVGNHFKQKSSNSTNCTWDGGWNMTYVGNGEVTRNEDRSVGYAKPAPVQRQLTVTRSNMDYKMAYGDIEWGISSANWYSDSFSKAFVEAHKFADVLIIPDYENQLSHRFTTIWGTIQNNPSIQKSRDNNTYSTTIDILELVDDIDDV